LKSLTRLTRKGHIKIKSIRLKGAYHDDYMAGYSYSSNSIFCSFFSSSCEEMVKGAKETLSVFFEKGFAAAEHADLQINQYHLKCP
jgi:hypothetical protein